MTTGPNLVIAFLAAWLAIGVILSIVLGRRGHDRVQWLLLGALLGPLALVLAADALRNGEEAEPESFGSPASIEVDPEAIDVMIGYDGSADSEAAIESALELFGDRLGRFELVSVIPFDGGLAAERDARATLERRTRDLSWVSPTARIVRGLPSQALAKAATERHFDVLAVGRTGSGRAPIFGSTARQLSSQNNVRVLLAGAKAKAA